MYILNQAKDQHFPITTYLSRVISPENNLFYHSNACPSGLVDQGAAQSAQKYENHRIV